MFECQKQYHRCAHMALNYFCFKKGPNSPKYGKVPGKHRAKQELETVPPQASGTVPPKACKNDPSDRLGGTVSNS